jgi:hypothetical protein
MWPRGLRTRACRNCHKVTVLPTCKECGGETAEITVFNAPGADARLRWQPEPEPSKPEYPRMKVDDDGSMRLVGVTSLESGLYRMVKES